MNDFQTANSIIIPSEFFNRIKTNNEALDSLFGDGILPGSVTTLSAKAGTGKTQFCLQLLQLLQIDYNVGYISNEESVEQLAFTSKRINTTDVPVKGFKTAQDVVKCIAGRDLLIVDSFSKIEGLDNMRARQVEKYALDMIIENAKKHKCAVILITHNTKGGQSKGSSLVLHDPDANMFIETVEEDPRLRRIWFDKNRFGSPSEIYLEMTSTGYLLKQVVATEETSSKSSKGELRRSTIISALENLGEASAVDIAYYTDIDLDKVKNHLRELREMENVIKDGRGAEAKYMLTARDNYVVLE